jgi:hypothetical protein
MRYFLTECHQEIFPIGGINSFSAAYAKKLGQVLAAAVFTIGLPAACCV